ncbi:uncharacterized protein LOC118468662 [Anopheles albimanus]|uniref:Uncharacterized protein n=1 Tax=Anopheles albimanus TaxID=7167 RepID=A0A182FQA2_ANOAL|nr:uncharacterized protein LOC118468662 [Anopheles albimanus]
MEKITLPEFRKKLVKYDANNADFDEQNADLIRRMEALLHQRDACLKQLAKESKNARKLKDDLHDLKYEKQDALELLSSLQKKCDRLAEATLTETDEITATPVQAAVSGDDDKSNAQQQKEQLFYLLLRKYCNLYLQYDTVTNGVRVLSLDSTKYFEFCIDSTVNNATERELAWANLGSTSSNLASWENLLGNSLKTT